MCAVSYRITVAMCAGVLACSALGVQIETVTVGHAGNPGELSGQSAGGFGPDRVCGAVDYAYQIGTYEVTAGQYVEFLNAVAALDTYGLYNESMSLSDQGCQIDRLGGPGSYAYTVDPEYAARPVNFISWGDAARFANWMHNGQPTGAQGPATTEDGSYFLDGATTDAALLAVVREAAATWVIPSEDEWYKAAYHYNDGVTGNYYDYPTGTDLAPSNDLVSPDAGNNANFYQSGGYTVGAPYWRTEVGDFENSASPYDTFDQGGNVWEWNEAILSGQVGMVRGLRGGAYSHNLSGLRAATRMDLGTPSSENEVQGFRLAYIPEPTSLLGFVLVAGALARRRT